MFPSFRRAVEQTNQVQLTFVSLKLSDFRRVFMASIIQYFAQHAATSLQTSVRVIATVSHISGPRPPSLSPTLTEMCCDQFCPQQFSLHSKSPAPCHKLWVAKYTQKMKGGVMPLDVSS
jgi:hypothetical protein